MKRPLFSESMKRLLFLSLIFATTYIMTVHGQGGNPGAPPGGPGAPGAGGGDRGGEQCYCCCDPSSTEPSCCYPDCCL